jgi:hypothetical protein
MGRMAKPFNSLFRRRLKTCLAFFRALATCTATTLKSLGVVGPAALF